jgi:hypothetical protein
MPGRHLELLQHLAGSRIDAPDVALVAFPGAVPEFAVDPGDAGDEAVALDGAQNLSRLGIDLMDLAVPILPTQSVPSAQASPESPPPPGAGMVASTRPVAGSIFWMRSSAIWNRCWPSKAVPACAATSIERTVLPLAGSRRSACRRMRTRRAAVIGDAMHASTPGKGPYSRMISAADRFMLLGPSDDHLIIRQRSGSNKVVVKPGTGGVIQRRARP